MPARGGGGRRGEGAGPPMSPVLERPEAAQGGAPAEPRSLTDIFPQRDNANRGRELQGTWRAFCQDMAGAPQAAPHLGRSPPANAYSIGELPHHYFRTPALRPANYKF